LSGDGFEIRILRALSAFWQWAAINPPECAEYALAEAAKEYGVPKEVLQDYLLRQAVAAEMARRGLSGGRTAAVTEATTA
jgi:hypothetical protein